MPLVRLQKYIADQGWMSRRKAEDAIAKGWVKVNGATVTEMGVKVDPAADKVTLSDEAKAFQKSRIILAFNKPRGVVSNLPQGAEKEIRDILPKKYQHLSTIGRLDKDSEGLILLTDDGVFARRCLDHSSPHEREYLVWVNKPLGDDALEEFRSGMRLGDDQCKPVEIRELSPLQYSMILLEGKNRQIRRMIQKAGSAVTRLRRVRFGKYNLGKLQKGSCCEVTVSQIL